MSERAIDTAVAEIDPQHRSRMPFTSGSTARSKSAGLVHLATVLATMRHGRYGPTDDTLAEARARKAPGVCRARLVKNLLKYGASLKPSEEAISATVIPV